MDSVEVSGSDHSGYEFKWNPKGVSGFQRPSQKTTLKRCMAFTGITSGIL
jgi:hypothetical protein